MMSFHWSAEIPVRTDATICADVECELQWDPRVDDRRIGVSCERGILTLSGYVADVPARIAAENVAGRVAGVKAVADRIRISPAAGGSVSDTWIAAAAAAALLRNVATHASTVIPIVCSGSVTLKGTVHWAFQRQAAETSMRGIRGVVEVANEICVLPFLGSLHIRRLSRSMRRASTPEARPAVLP